MQGFSAAVPGSRHSPVTAPTIWPDCLGGSQLLLHTHTPRPYLRGLSPQEEDQPLLLLVQLTHHRVRERLPAPPLVRVRLPTPHLQFVLGGEQLQSQRPDSEG
jgi:hypothetical protein